MVYVGIDVAKDKHDCFIIDGEGVVLHEAFVIRNNLDGFMQLYGKIISSAGSTDDVEVGLESTGHYGYNLLNFLVEKKLKTFVINPLHTTLFRKSLSLRQTKTDRIDTRAIAYMLMSDVRLTEYNPAIEREELKSLSRYRYNKVRERARLKVSVAKLVNMLFPELEGQVSSIHNKSVYKLLLEFPSAKDVAKAEASAVETLLRRESKGHYGAKVAEAIMAAAEDSVGTYISAKALELKHTVRMILQYDDEVAEVDVELKKIMDIIGSPILSIPGVSYTIGAMILGEIGDFRNFSSPDKIMAYAGISPTVYQSGNIKAGVYSHMEKRGSKYLRYALFNATRFVCNWDDGFKEYLQKKLAEGKHYKVAVSHASKKLVRVMFKLEKTGEEYERGYNKVDIGSSKSAQ